MCSEHFTDDCFETDLKAQLMPKVKVKRRFKCDAIPSVFSLGPEPKKPVSSENRESRQRAQEIRDEVGVEYRTQINIFLVLMIFQAVPQSTGCVNLLALPK